MLSRGPRNSTSIASLGGEGWDAVGGVEYAADLFDARDHRTAWLGRLAAICEEARRAPGGARSRRSPACRRSERQQLLAEWGDGRGRDAAPEALLIDAFAAQVARRADAVALALEGAALSYGELFRRGGRLARRLAARGVGPEAPVALCAERALELDGRRCWASCWPAGSTCRSIRPIRRRGSS